VSGDWCWIGLDIEWYWVCAYLTRLTFLLPTPGPEQGPVRLYVLIVYVINNKYLHDINYKYNL